MPNSAVLSWGRKRRPYLRIASTPSRIIRRIRRARQDRIKDDVALERRLVVGREVNGDSRELFPDVGRAAVREIIENSAIREQRRSGHHA